MPLTFSGPNLTAETGASETISIQPVPPQTSTQVTFTAATYGTRQDGGPQTLPGVAGTTSLTFTVLAGLNRLVFGLVSPSPQLQSVNITQGSTILSTASVQFNSGSGSLLIIGTATLFAAGPEKTIDESNHLEDPGERVLADVGQLRNTGWPDGPKPNAHKATTPRVNSRTPDVPDTVLTTAETPSNLPNLSINVSTVSDTPTTDDELGFTTYVTAIAKFLASENTKGPLTLSIEGEWGCGKSSFMKQMEKLLKAPPNDLLIEGKSLPVTRTFWFDAWRQDRQEELWAAFAMAFCRKLRKDSKHKWRAGFRLAFRRARSNPDMSGLTLAFIKAAAWMVGITLCYTQLSKPNLKYFVTVTVMAAAAMHLFKALKEVLGSPFETHISEYLRGPDYSQRVAFVERFHDDFSSMLDAYADRVGKIYVFIDDVDRCEVPKAADLMQAINLLIGEDARLIFILGMDRDKVAAGISAKYKDLAPYLKGTDNADDDVVDYGFRFLEKFIQLPFRIPDPSAQAIGKFIDKISAPPDGEMSETTTLTAKASASSTSPGATSTTQRRVERNLESGGDSAGVSEAAKMFAATLSRSPRKVKQFVNVFRLRAYIANQLALFDDDYNGTPKLTFEQLAKLVGVSLIWPKLVADLGRTPSLLASLEETATTSFQDAHGSAKPTTPEKKEGSNENPTAATLKTNTDWSKITQLTALLQYGRIERPTWPASSQQYSLARVDLVPMLEISPEVKRNGPDKTESRALHRVSHNEPTETP